jgi:hypothetical protein
MYAWIVLVKSVCVIIFVFFVPLVLNICDFYEKTWQNLIIHVKNSFKFISACHKSQFALWVSRTSLFIVREGKRDREGVGKVLRCDHRGMEILHYCIVYISYQIMRFKVFTSIYKREINHKLQNNRTPIILQ